MDYYVSLTRPIAYRSLLEVAQLPVPDGTLKRIFVEPGEYRMDGLRYWGTAEIIASEGPGTVTLDCSAEYTVRVEGKVTLRDLTLRNWADKGQTIQVVGGVAILDNCQIHTRGDAVSVWDGGDLTLSRCDLHDGALIFSDAIGDVSHTTVSGAPSCAIAIHKASKVTIRDVTISNAGEHGIWINTGSSPLIERCTVTRSGSAHVLVQERSRALLRDCRLSDSGKCGFVVRDRSVATLEDATISRSGVDDVWVTTDSRLDATRVTMTGAVRNSVGVDLRGEAHFVSSTMESPANIGLFVDDTAVTQLRDVTIRGGEIGVRLTSGARLDGTNVLITEHRAIGVHLHSNAQAQLTGSSRIEHNLGVGTQLEEGSSLTGDYVESDNGVPATSAAGAVTTPAPPAAAPTPPAPPVDVAALMAELDAMIGLGGVKHEITKLVSLLKAAEQRRRAGLAPGPVISRHMVFAGPPGTGKTTVARLYGKILAALAVVSNGGFTEVSRADLVGQVLGGTTAKTTEVVTAALGGVLFIDEAYTLSRQFGTGSDFGQEAIDTLVKLIEDHRDDLVVVFAGYATEMRDFLNANPGLSSRVSRTIAFENYSPAELAEIASSLASSHGFVFAEEAEQLLTKHFQRIRRDDNFGNGREARRIFEAAIENQAVRLAELPEPTTEDLTTLLPSDLDGIVDASLVSDARQTRDSAQVDDVFERMDRLVGMTEVKARMRDVVDLITAARLRKAAGLATAAVTGNLILTGPPGTGKTTVARLYGELLSALGVSATGQVVEVSRMDLVGQHLGETTAKTAAKFAQARGGVLFLDEAYTLSRQFGTGSDFGQEAIDTLVKLIEDHREEVVVIVAGYSREMTDFLAANPGLASRFDHTIDFAPYTQDDLVSILELMVESAGFVLRAETREAARSVFLSDTARFAEGNGREVRKLFERARTAHARRLARLVAGGTPDHAALTELEPADLDS
ncbi:AAA family ATPase [Stackebrandtia soli]|uniref:AAA family ATPase n=1 Tax=Stackebrandtia soli TaxID=1892856 RepID=UPI0039E92D34